MNISRNEDPNRTFDIRLAIDLDPERDFSRPSWLPWDTVLQWPASASHSNGDVRPGVERPDPLNFDPTMPVTVVNLSLWLKMEHAGHTEYWVAGPGYKCLPAQQQLDLMDDFEKHRKGIEEQAEDELTNPMSPDSDFPW